MGNSLIPSGDDDGFNNVPLTGRGAMRGSPITYNAVDGNYWRDRVDVVNGEKLVVLGCRRGYQYWPLDGSAPQLLLDEPGAPHPKRSAFGDQDTSKWRDGPNGKSDPYVDIWALFCANPDAGAESTFITPTAGGFMAAEILVEEIRKKRRREPDAYPLARLEDTTFKTRYGVKKRPHFAIVGWVFPGGEREPTPAPEPPKPTTAAVPPAPAPAAATPPVPRGRATITPFKAKVKPETVASGVNPLDDDIPFDV
jgi:hypothetical protein